MRIWIRRLLQATLAFYLLSFGALAAFQRDVLFHPDAQVVSPAAADVPAQEIHLTTTDGESLVAWKIDPPPGRPLIVYFHGKGGILADRAERFRLFAKSGWGLLAVAWRGYGGSSGTPSEAGLRLDAEAAYAEAARLASADRLVLMGESLGTGLAVGIAARHPAAALVLDSAYASIEALAQQRYPMFPVGLAIRDPFRTDHDIGNVHMPLLMTHGEADAIIPIAEARKLFALANDPKTFLELPGGPHVMLSKPAMFPKAQAWIEAATRAAAAN